MTTYQDSLLLRRLTAHDHQDILTLWQRTGLHSIRPSGRDSLESMSQQAATGVQEILGLLDGQQLIAVIVVTHDGRKGWLNRLAVDPDYRGKGLARRLIRDAESWLTEQGIDVWAVLIEDYNNASLELFRSEGYQTHKDIFYMSKRPDPGA